MKAINFFLNQWGLAVEPLLQNSGGDLSNPPPPQFSAPGSMLLIGIRGCMCSSEIFLKIIQLGVFWTKV